MNFLHHIVAAVLVYNTKLKCFLVTSEELSSYYKRNNSPLVSCGIEKICQSIFDKSLNILFVLHLTIA